jgi:cobalt/nickel transport protein
MRALPLFLALAPLLAGTVAWAHLPVLRADPVMGKKKGEIVLTHGYGHPAEAKWFACAKPDTVTVYAPDGAEFDATPGLASFGEPEQLQWRTSFTPILSGDHVAVLRCRSRVGRTRFDDAVKVVVHAGGAPKGWGRRVGTPVEFVPLTRPYALPKGASFRARLLFEGKPLAGAIVGIEHLAEAPPKEKPPSDLFTIRQERTNADGEFSVTLPETGWWVLFASVAGRAVKENGQTLKRKHRGSFLVPVGW